jgi:hypothetical protein
MRLDVEETWPQPLRALLNDNLPLLRAFEHARAEWNARCIEDVAARCMHSPNPHTQERDAVLAQCESLIRDVALVGYHCTRLCEQEVDLILDQGMRPLSPALVEDRLRNAVVHGHLHPDLAALLQRMSQAGKSNRQGMIYFIFTEASLRDGYGISPLLQSWGGEALYWAHGEGSEAAEALAAIGEPCIIEAAVPSDQIQTYCSVGERVMRAWLDRRGIRTGYCPEMEGHIRDAVPANRVLRVIRHSDPDFEQLTACSRWRKPLTSS